MRRPTARAALLCAVGLLGTLGPVPRPGWLLAPAVAAAQEGDAGALRAAAAELWDAGRREQALEQLEPLLARHPDDASLRRQLAEWQMAVHRYAAALETARSDPELRHVAGQALYVLGRHQEALQHLDRSDPLQALMRVDALERLGHDDATWTALQEAEAVLGANSAPLLAVRGRLAAGASRHEDAVAAFAAALDLDPYHLSARFGLGQSLLRLDRREEALLHLQRHRELVPLMDQLDFALRAIDLAPRHAANHAQLGDVERSLGRLQQAGAAYERAATLADEAERVPIALRHARLLAEDLGDLDGALAVLQAAQSAQPDARLLVRSGDLLGGAGRWVEALEVYTRAQALRPADQAIAARLARARAECAGDAPAEPPR